MCHSSCSPGFQISNFECVKEKQGIISKKNLKKNCIKIKIPSSKFDVRVNQMNHIKSDSVFEVDIPI